MLHLLWWTALSYSRIPGRLPFFQTCHRAPTLSGSRTPKRGSSASPAIASSLFSHFINYILRKWPKNHSLGKNVWCFMFFYKNRTDQGGIRDGGIDTRGLQCFKLNGNHTEKDRYWQKNNFLLFAKCLKMYSFFAFAFKVCKKCYYEPKKIILGK